MFWLDEMKKEIKLRLKSKLDQKLEELIMFKDLIKLLSGLIDLYKELIEKNKFKS